MTIDDALNNLVYTTKVVKLKQKLSERFIHEDTQLNYLLANSQDAATQKLIDQYCDDLCNNECG